MRRTATVLAVLATAIALAGCSSSSSSPSQTGSAAAASPSVATGEGGASVVSTGGAKIPGGSAGASPSTAARGEKGTATASGPALPDPDAAVIYTFARAQSSQAQRFHAATSSIKGVYSQLNVITAVRLGSGQADVASYRFSGQQAASALFQSQIVSQLVAKVAGAKHLRYQSIDGRQAVVATGSNSAVGYFTGTTAVVVLARAGGSAKHSLATASSVAYAYSRR